MTLTMREAHRHADRILELVAQRRPAAGQRPGGAVVEPLPQRIPARSGAALRALVRRPRRLEERRARRADVIACARYEMTTLYQRLADAEAAVVLTDTDGVIVHMVSSPEFAAEVGPLGLRVGGTWSRPPAPTAWAPASPRARRCRCGKITSSTSSPSSPARPCRCTTLGRDRRGARRHQPLRPDAAAPAGAAGHDRAHDREPPDRRALPQRPPAALPQPPEFVYTLHEDASWRWATTPHPRRQPQRAVPARPAVDGRHARAPHRGFLPDLAGETCSQQQRLRSTRSSPTAPSAALRFFAVARRPTYRRTPKAPVLAGPACRWPKTPLAVGDRRWRMATRRPDPAPATFSTTPGSLRWTPRAASSRARRRCCCAADGLRQGGIRARCEASPHASGAQPWRSAAPACQTLIDPAVRYRAGAFTGAQQSARQEILQADGGALFLDEIADMPLELRARLLRVLDEAPGDAAGHRDIRSTSARQRQPAPPTLVREDRSRGPVYYRLAGIS